MYRKLPSFSPPSSLLLPSLSPPSSLLLPFFSPLPLYSHPSPLILPSFSPTSSPFFPPSYLIASFQILYFCTILSSCFSFLISPLCPCCMNWYCTVYIDPEGCVFPSYQGISTMPHDIYITNYHTPTHTHTLYT